MSRRLFLTGFRLFVIWLAVWPLVMLALVALEYVAPSLPFVLQTLVLTGLMVPMIALAVAPLAGLIVGCVDRSTGAERRARYGKQL